MASSLYDKKNNNRHPTLILISLLAVASSVLSAIQSQPNSGLATPYKPPPQPVQGVSPGGGNLTKLPAPNIADAKSANGFASASAQPRAALPGAPSTGLLSQPAPWPATLPSLAVSVLKTLPLNTTALQKQAQTIPLRPTAGIMNSPVINRPAEQPLPVDSPRINQEDPIIQLDYSTISDSILHKPTVNIVYFNANFNSCRHCQRFFANWKELALDIRWWRQVIKLFTINCSDEDNIDVCRRAGVTQFPQVKFYWTMSDSLDQDGQRLRVLGKSVHAIRHLIMDKVLESYMEHNKLIAQRAKQRSSSSAAVNPIAALLGVSGGGGASQFGALMPLIGQLLGGTGSKEQTTTTTGAGGLKALSGVIGLLTGQGGGGGGKQPAGEGLSIGSLINSFGGLQGIGQLINAVSSFASWRRSLTIQPLASNWPELDPIEETDSLRLLDMLPLKPGIGALLIMETQEFLYTGLEVMLDLNPYSNRTYIARVRDERSQLSKNLTKRDDIQAPALIYIAESRAVRLIATAPKYTNDEDLRRIFVRAFERRQIKYPVKRMWSPSFVASAPLRNDSSEDEDILNRVDNVYMNDLLNTIRASLTDQVFIHPDLSDDQYTALVRYVYALINYFPFKSDERLKFFKRLHTWLQNQVSPVDIAEYKKQFYDFDEVIGKHDWVSCKSLSSINAIQAKSRTKSGLLFQNPSQLGKMVSNITRLFRANRQKASQLKNLISMFTSRSSSPVMLSNPAPNNGAQLKDQLQQQQRHQKTNVSTSTTSAPATAIRVKPASTSSTSIGEYNDKRQSQMMSSVEKLIKTFTNGSLGSDVSILKLISTALTGGDASSSSKSAKSKFAREYPCGAWKLAHVMVVNEYVKDSPRKDVRHIVMHSLYQYMLHFYACPTCGNRVSDMRGEFRLNLDQHLNDQADSIMLLWKIHNRANKRLESEIRPGSPTKQQFPSESLCPKCRGPKQQNDLVSTPNWHEKQVLNFLVHHYRPQSIIVSADTTSGDSSSSSSSPSLLSSLHFVTPTQSATRTITSTIMFIKRCAAIAIGLGSGVDEPDYFFTANLQRVLYSWPPPVALLPSLISVHLLYCVNRNHINILVQTRPS